MLSDIQREVYDQPKLLDAQSAKKVRKLPAGTLFVGAGDSYIVGQCVAFLSSFRHAAVDPYVLISSPGISKDRVVVFISVSGRTQSNVTAAKKVKKVAARTLALTANPNSSLTAAVAETLLIPYPYKPRIPGTLSFTLSLVTALKIVAIDSRCEFSHLFERAKSHSRDLLISEDGTSVFLGNQASYTVALYAAAKTYEFFGGRAQAELLEQFSHMELFSLRKEDTVNVFSSSDRMAMGKKLVAALGANGYSASLVSSHGRNSLEQVFFEIFLTQLSVVGTMKRRKLGVPYFMKSREKIDVSDAMIY